MKNLRRSVAVTTIAALLIVMAVPAFAGRKPSGPTGTIDLAQAEAAAATTSVWPGYGDTVWFATTVEGKVANNSSLFVRVVCRNDAGRIVYQWSGAVDFGFPLSDQPGQNLHWEGEAATCQADLVYLVEKGRNIEMTTLATDWFDVAPMS